MADENAERYREVVEAWNAGEVDDLVGFMSEDVTVSSFLVAVEGGYLGHEGIRRWWADFHEAFPDWHAEIVDLSDVGDATVARLRLRGHGRDSGAPVDMLMWHVVHWGADGIFRISAHRDEAEALEAAGGR